MIILSSIRLITFVLEVIILLNFGAIDLHAMELMSSLVIVFIKMTQRNSGLAFAYFFSNLLEDVYIANNNFKYGIPTELSNLLYPIAEGKEITKIRDIDINP